MPSRKIAFVSGEFYHIYNRGNSKQVIFRDDEDRERFVKLLYVCNTVSAFDWRDSLVKHGISAWDFERIGRLVDIGAWVLMPNHFHIYATPSGNDGSPTSVISRDSLPYFMQKVATSYSKYFNAKYERTGSLFESAFKAEHVSRNEHAKYLFSYIHLNPVKLIDIKWRENGIKNIKKTKAFLETYPWSSYADYTDTTPRSEVKVLAKSAFPAFFTAKIMEREIYEWITYKPDIF